MPRSRPSSLPWIAPATMVLAAAIGGWWVHHAHRKPAIIVPSIHVDDHADPSLPRVLVFTRTMGYRHQSIPAGVKAVQALGEGRWITEHTEDPESFTPEQLARFRAVIFLSTTGNVLRPAGQRSLEAYMRGGGGWVGVHAAADTEYEWPWYGELVGAWFRNHTNVIEADVKVERPDGPGMRGVPNPWHRRDEWYAFRTDPRPHVDVLASLDDAQLGDASMGGDHPIVWWHMVDKGRAWYTGMGHTVESFSEPAFLSHLKGGIEWAAGMVASP